MDNCSATHIDVPQRGAFCIKTDIPYLLLAAEVADLDRVLVWVKWVVEPWLPCCARKLPLPLPKASFAASTHIPGPIKPDFTAYLQSICMHISCALCIAKCTEISMQLCILCSFLVLPGSGNVGTESWAVSRTLGCHSVCREKRRLTDMACQGKRPCLSICCPEGCSHKTVLAASAEEADSFPVPWTKSMPLASSDPCLQHELPSVGTVAQTRGLSSLS